MNYYPHHIGDFDRATRHLTRIERSVYRDLIEVYYDTEKPLTLDEPMLCRKIIARSKEETDAVSAVLVEFFHKTPTGWYHDRCEEELESYRKSTSQKSTAGKASAAARATRRQQAINGCSTAVERASNGTPTNQEPRTKNQEPEEVQNHSAAKATEIAVESRADVVEAIQNGAPLAVVVEKASTPRIDFGPDAREVFAYWQHKRGHERAKLDEKRAKAIKARLKDGYTVGDICLAVDGIARSAHHMGQNDARTVYDDIELICRTAANVDKFAKLAGAQKFTDPGLQRQVEILQDWMEQP